MSKHPEFHNIDDSSDAVVRQLDDGLTAHIYPGDQAMISVVTVAPGAEGSMHDHPEEQWGLCLEGSGTRFQGGEEIAFSKGDFWRTPGGVPHTMRAGEDGCRVLDLSLIHISEPTRRVSQARLRFWKRLTHAGISAQHQLSAVVSART